MFDELEKQIEELATGFAAKVSSEIFDVEIHTKRDGLAIVVIADFPRGGITVDECSSINRELVEVIDEKGMITSDYTLEVNSPGLDQPLKTYRDYRRVIGREVRFYLKEKIDGKKEHMGEIQDANEHDVFVKTKQSTLSIPMKLINKALQEIS